jgi:hypothetical protein
MDAVQRREFVKSHRTAVFGYQHPRLHDGRAWQGKGSSRNPKVSLCVLDEKWSPTCVVVYCDAKVETEEKAVVDLMIGIAGVMAGQPMPESVRPMISEGAKREVRAVLRLRPYATFYTPPRHVSSEADLSTLTHEVSASIPW